MSDSSSEDWQCAWEFVKLSNDCNFSDRRGVPLLSLCIIVSFNFEMLVILSHEWINRTRRMLSDLYIVTHALLRSFILHLRFITKEFVRRPNKMHHSARETDYCNQAERTYLRHLPKMCFVLEYQRCQGTLRLATLHPPPPSVNEPRAPVQEWCPIIQLQYCVQCMLALRGALLATVSQSAVVKNGCQC